MGEEFSWQRKQQGGPHGGKMPSTLEEDQGGRGQEEGMKSGGSGRGIEGPDYMGSCRPAQDFDFILNTVK